VHGAGHLDGFDRTKPGILYNVDGTHPQHHLVFDDGDVPQLG